MNVQRWAQFALASCAFVLTTGFSCEVNVNECLDGYEEICAWFNGERPDDMEPDPEPDDAYCRDLTWEEESGYYACSLSDRFFCDGRCVDAPSFDDGDCLQCDMGTHQWCNGECIREELECWEDFPCEGFGYVEPDPMPEEPEPMPEPMPEPAPEYEPDPSPEDGEPDACNLLTHQWCNGECVPEGACSE